MKRIISSLIALTVTLSVFLILPFTASAQTSYDAQRVYEICGNYDYTLLADDTVQIERYNGSAEAVYVPATLDGYKVTSLGDFVFFESESLKEVTIPKSVTSISGSALNNCKILSKIKIDSDNKVYDSRENCNAVIETKTNTLIVGCMNTIIPESVTHIADGAFSGCIGLTTITIPDGVQSLGGALFFYCENLTSITISQSVKSIDEDVFCGCENISEIKIDSDNKVYDSRGNCNAIIETKTNTLLYGCMNTVIPDSVESIGEDAFNMCAQLTSITIPDSVTSIREGAFWACDSLKTVTIPRSVSHIGDYAFGSKEKSTCLYVYKNSAAHKFAKSNSSYCDFVVLDDGGEKGNTDSIEDNISAFSVFGVLLWITIPVIFAIIAITVMLLIKKRK